MIKAGQLGRTPVQYSVQFPQHPKPLDSVFWIQSPNIGIVLLYHVAGKWYENLHAGCEAGTHFKVACYRVHNPLQFHPIS